MLLSNGLHKRTEYVFACGCLVFGIQVSVSAVPKCEAIMVPARDYRVSGSAFFDELHPTIGVVVVGCKTLGLFQVVFMSNIAIVKRPGLVNAVDCINSPVNENAQFGIGKPLHFFSMSGIHIGFVLPKGGIGKDKSQEQYFKF